MGDELDPQRMQRLQVRVRATQVRVPLDLVMDRLMPSRVARIIAVSFLAEDGLVRIEAEIVPAMDPYPDDAPAAVQDEWRSQNLYAARISDDAGTEYDDGGGATGLSPDGQKTCDSYSFWASGSPSPRWVELVFSPSHWAQGAALRTYVVRITRD